MGGSGGACSWLRQQRMCPFLASCTNPLHHRVTPISARRSRSRISFSDDPLSLRSSSPLRSPVYSAASSGEVAFHSPLPRIRKRSHHPSAHILNISSCRGGGARTHQRLKARCGRNPPLGSPTSRSIIRGGGRCSGQVIDDGP